MVKMTIEELILELRQRGVKFSLSGESLRSQAPKGALTPALRQEVQERKAELIAFLRNGSAIRVPTIQSMEGVRCGDIPLSSTQQRLWFLSQLEVESAAYNMFWPFRLTGALNVPALEESLNEIVQRHEVLRTTFQAVNGTPIQVIAPTSQITLAVIDVTSSPAVEIQRLINEAALRPFSLEKDIMLRAMVLGLGQDEHMLLITLHHIAFDGWSMEVFWRELTALYAAAVAGKPSPLPPLSIQYADFAIWQQELLQGAFLQEQLAYWKQQLHNLPILQLPIDHPRPPVQSFRGAAYSFDLSAALCDDIVHLSRQAEATLFMSFLAAFNVLLSRYTGQEDIAVGSLIANRNRAEIEDLIGFFVNTLVLRTDLSGNPTFRDTLARVRDMTLGAYQHQDMPFEKLVEELAPTRDMSQNPLVQVLFIVQTAPQSPYSLPGLSVTVSQDFEVQTVRFDLEFHLWPSKTKGFVGQIFYNRALFDVGTIERMAGHFQTLLEGIVANPETPISALPLLTDAERQQLLVEWNDTATDYPQDKCIHQLFEAQVEKTPDAVAVVFEGQHLSYAALNQKANQLAHYLQTLGVKTEELVGICIERSLDMVIGLLGILKVGGAYLPLAPSYPAARLAFMLEDAEVEVLLTQSSLVKQLPKTTALVVCLDTETEKLSSLNIDNLASGVKSANLAYVMYTSGSTGQPKGVSIIHRGVVRLVKKSNYVNLTADEVLLQLAPISFDASTFEIWGSLLNGAKLIIMPPHTPSLEELGRVIAQYQITTLWLTASLFHLMVDERLADLNSVHQLLAGGEVLSVPHVEKVLRKIQTCQVINGYGPTENTTFTCCYPMTANSRFGSSVPIGRPIANTQVYILDYHRKLTPIGVPGELHVGGDGLARGYFNHPELTAEKFIPNPFSNEPKSCLYKTGDLARYLPDGNIEYLGRIDNQVKIRGFRIELGEIEAVLAQHPTVQESVVIVHEERLVAYLVPTQEQIIDNIELRLFLKERLPDYMIPSVFMPLEAMPLTPNGKIDRRALPKPDDSRPSLEATYVMPQTEAEQRIAEVWQQVLQLEKVGIYDNFFDLGGHSLLMVRVHSELQEIFGQSLSMVELFQYPTIHSLAKHLTQETQQTSEVFKTSEVSSKSKEIAIIGMAGRFPGAKNIETFWQNLRDGIESITFFSEEELLAEGVDPALLKNPNYVKANGVLEKIELFDAAFFGYSPKEAEIMDPQQRLFLECAWDAIENAGYDVDRISGAVGVYAGAGMNTYLSNNITRHPDIVESVGEYQLMITSEKDFLPTRTSYKLNLKGPSVYVQTACSTSLVAVHLACQSLHNNECDMALAGGVSVRARQKIGYLYQEGMIMSPDGHCRAFDAKAQGTIGGNGVGIVVLKRLDQALADGDCIHAVIKGSAINNDGSLKVGYTAPSVDGQTSVIAAAMKNIDYETISYIETHGTGTTLGDPIEMAALTQAYQSHTDKKGFCAIGSLKTNVGHLDAAAGVAGLIKTVLALKHKQLPPSLHFDQPNPKIDFANSPFFVNTALSEWKSDGKPRRASVSSFGIGGTNAHVVLEEAPDQLSVISDQLSEKPGIHRTWQLLVLSAKTASALETATANLAERFKQHPDINFADVAYTLSVGRQIFEHRRILVCQTLDEATELLSTPEHLFTQVQEHKARPVVFMFSGQGSQYVNMARELYQNESIFREHVDKCAEILKPHLSLDLRKVIYPNAEQITKQLEQTAIAQPALFVIEYALAQLWMVWGIHPVAMIGHSIGEYVAACLAGVFSLEDALALVAARGQLMQSLPGGAMLSVPLPESEILPLLNSEISLAAINTPTLCVVSGTLDAITTLENQLTKQSVDGLRLQTSHAFHSAMMEPILASFTAHVKKIRLNPPQIPYLSNVSGTWITAEQATDPDYWATHLRQTVRFAENLQELLKKPEYVLLEIGPGRTLTTLAGRHPDKTAEHNVVHTLRHPKEQPADMAFLLTTLGKLWLAGVSIDWPAFYAQAQYHRLPLPTYPFERQRYWIVPPTDAALTNVVAPSPTKKSDIADWFYIPSWKRSVLQTSEVLKTSEVLWLVFVDECGLAHQLVKRLQSHNVITVKKGKAFTQLSERDYTLNPQKRDDYEALLKKLNKVPQIIVHLWTVTDHLKSVEKAQELGFYSLLYLAQALTDVSDEIQLAVVSNNLHDVTGEEVLCPEKATVLGPVKVIGQEYPNIRCRSIDVVIPPSGINHKLIEPLLAELTSKSSDQVIAYRGKHRWVQTFEPVRLDKPVEETSRLRKNGVYLITGGLGQIGLVLAEHLAKTVQAKLILIGRSALPARDEWEDWLNTHDEHDEISRKIRKVQALEKLGAEVWVASVDVANLQQMQEVITIAEKRFGQINGVIHAAGMIGENTFRTIEQADQTHCEQQFQPKIHGTLVLEKVLQERKLDFCILLSSLSAVLGGLSYVAYSTANIFMDAFVQQHNQNHHMLWLSVNWDGWRFENETQPSSSLAQFALLPEEGVNAFQRILDYKGSNQLVVSTGNLQVRIDQWIKLERTNTKEVAPRYHRPKLPTSYVAPRDDVEQTLVEIWQQLLGIEQIGIHDEFFKLGGDSLIAVRLFTQIEKRIGKNLPMTTLIQAPTVEQLSNIIRQKGGLKPWSKSWSSLVPIQPSGGKRPFFLVPGGGGGKGEIMLYAKLVYLLGQEQPVYGLLARGLDGKQNPHTQVEAMATDYINEIRAFQPNGPYLLGGECIGGLVAFEMAQQLQAQGQIVSLLVLMDTMCPSGSSYFTYLVYRFFKIRKIRHHWKTISELEPERRLSYLFEKAKKAIWMLIAKFHINSVPPAQQIQQVSNEYEKTLMRYRPKVYPGSLVLLVSEGNYKQNPTSGWETLAKQGLEIYKLPGDHTSYIREEVQTTAKQLKACLDEAQQNISNVHRS